MGSPNQQKDRQKAHRMISSVQELQHSNSTAARSLGNRRKAWMSDCQSSPIIDSTNPPQVSNGALRRQTGRPSQAPELHRSSCDNSMTCPASDVPLEIDTGQGQGEPSCVADAFPPAPGSKTPKHRDEPSQTPPEASHALLSPSLIEGRNHTGRYPLMDDTRESLPLSQQCSPSSAANPNLGMENLSSTATADWGATTSTIPRTQSALCLDIQPAPDNSPEKSVDDGAGMVANDTIPRSSSPLPDFTRTQKRLRHGSDPPTKRLRMDAGPDLDFPFWTYLSLASPAHRRGESSHFKLLMRKCETAIENKKEAVNGPGAYERPRLELLSEACRNLDYSYLMIHQLYCHSSMTSNLNSGPRLSDPDRQAFQSLRYLLASNDDLHGDVLTWFARFPGILQPSGPGGGSNNDLQIWHSNALNTVRSIAQNWSVFQTNCLNRKFPPVVSELCNNLRVQSPVLQQVIFRAILRGIVGADNERSKQHEMIFEQNQQLYAAKEASVSNPGGKPFSDQPFFEAHYQVSLTCVSPNPPLSSNGRASSNALPQCADAQQLMPRTSSRTPFSHLAAQSDTEAGSQVLLSTSSRPPGSIQMPRLRFMPCDHGSASIQSSNNEGTSEFRRRAQVQPCSGTNLATSDNSPFPERHPRTQSPSISPLLGSQQQTITPFPAFRSSHSLSCPISDQAPISPHNDLFGNAVPRGDWAYPGSLHRPNVGFSSRQPDALNLQSLQSIGLPRNALHQIHLVSPKMLTSTTERCFRYVKQIYKPPKSLSASTCHYQHFITITDAEYSAIAIDVANPYGVPKSRLLYPGSLTYRVRSIKAGHSGAIPTDEGWLTADHVWPASIAILLNDQPLEFRRRSLYGRDLPVDVTRLIKTGSNIMTVAIMGLSAEKTEQYLVGLEAIQTHTATQIKATVKRDPAEMAKQRIMSKMCNSDPEIEVLDARLTLDMTDPFSSAVFTTPVRGVNCSHDQCFDLETFLSTRANVGRSKEDPCPATEFRCPVCRGDVRPGKLVIDGFLESIRNEFKSTDRLNVKAVKLGIDGHWEAKEEEPMNGQSGDGDGRQRDNENREQDGTSSLSAQADGRSRGIEVIDLDG